MLKKILFVIMLICISVPAGAVELLMFTSDRCSYCQNFLKEIRPEYGESKYGKTLPLKVISIDIDPPKWAEIAMGNGTLHPIRVTPTFVLWDNKEIVRTEGYRSKEQFYMIMEAFNQSVPRQKGPLVPFLAPDMGAKTNPHIKGEEKDKHGVFLSNDIMEHQYKTPEEAIRAAINKFGCEGIHSHTIKGKKIWMPCKMQLE